MIAKKTKAPMICVGEEGRSATSIILEVAIVAEPVPTGRRESGSKRTAAMDAISIGLEQVHLTPIRTGPTSPPMLGFDLFFAKGHHHGIFGQTEMHTKMRLH